MAPSRRLRGKEDGKVQEPSSPELKRQRRRRMGLGVKGARFLPRLWNKLLPFARIEMRKEVKLLLRKYLPPDQVRKLVRELARREVKKVVCHSGEPNQGPEEVEGLVGDPGQSNPSLPMNQNSTPRYRLQFQKDLTKFVYTFDKVKAKDGKDVEIAIFDTVLECVVTSTPLSSAKVDVVVLYGDFGDNGEESWSEKYFRKKIVKSREGKERLLSGKITINLNEGVGRFKDIEFKDNPRSWTGKKEFKLGLRLHKNEDTQVREGISSRFTVKDRRVKGNEKRHPPSPMDKVYYLEGIRKDGPIHKRLLAGNISNVQELLQVFGTNPEYLRGLLGSTKKAVAEGKWKAITEHARECHLGDEREQVSVENLKTCTFQRPDSIQSFGPLTVASFLNHPQETLAIDIHSFSPLTVASFPNPPQQTLVISTQEISSLTDQLEHIQDDLLRTPEDLYDARYPDNISIEDFIRGDWNYFDQMTMQGKPVSRWTKLFLWVRFVVHFKHT